MAEPEYVRVARAEARKSRNGEGSARHNEPRYPENLESDPPRQQEPSQHVDPEPRLPPRFKFLSSAEFAAKECRLEWLVKRLLVNGQPGVIGGPKKSLKTSLIVDLALSLGTGVRFLGEFEIPKPARIAIMSGESGQATLKETALRICRAKEIDLPSANVLWEFVLPQLSNAADLRDLQTVLKDCGVEVLLLDPLYLSILAGAGPKGPQAGNVFQMGPLFSAISETCLTIGCTPILAHHFRLKRDDQYAEPQLEDLTFAGVQEFCRQWLLVGRREPYQSGSGAHRLWLSVGGSAGHSSLWSLDIDEGTIGDDFTGRRWEVSLSTASAARESERAAKEQERKQAQAQQDRTDDDALLTALDRLTGVASVGASYNVVQTEARLSDSRMLRAVTRLKQEKIIKEVDVTVIVGNGAKRPARGLRRVETGT